MACLSFHYQLVRGGGPKSPKAQLLNLKLNSRWEIHVSVFSLSAAGRRGVADVACLGTAIIAPYFVCNTKANSVFFALGELI